MQGKGTKYSNFPIVQPCTLFQHQGNHNRWVEHYLITTATVFVCRGKKCSKRGDVGYGIVRLEVIFTYNLAESNPLGLC